MHAENAGEGRGGGIESACNTWAQAREGRTFKTRVGTKFPRSTSDAPASLFHAHQQRNLDCRVLRFARNDDGKRTSGLQDA